MFSFTLNRLLQRAKNGDEGAREELIRKHRDFIARVSSRICKRFLCWENDDELSIALLAFNEAIDSYHFDRRTSFSSFAYTVIHRRLTDYFRKNPAKYELLLSADQDDTEDSISSLLDRQAQDTYRDQLQREKMAETIDLFRQRLSCYDITLEDLFNCSPRHQDTREKLMQAAMTVAHNPVLLNHLENTQRLPAKQLVTITGLSHRVLEKWRKYIIATILILTDPHLSALKRFTKGF
ncbi:sigma-70 family RNA polymerase sigma factor [Desulfotomaculum nigrificans]|uniref:sigma-70 family RNA polymerase sigma factor n=1 Tax=Desulfotomaculum nigrificans TaxID=1565 RepID=UPI0001FAE9CF|nr:sigma-70 family RNA polymerase sigma factor [Desulfotomaculum nigrificans]